MKNKDKYDVTKLNLYCSKPIEFKDLNEVMFIIELNGQKIKEYQINECWSCWVKTYNEWLEGEE